jgi:uncharacterized membrane protein YedE/YeeE
MNRNAELGAALVGGLLFGVGLLVAGMVQPQNVLGFLDLFGDWRPALAFVMGGAIAVNAVAVQVARRMGRPVFGEAFHLPTRRDLDPRLLGGAVIFGAGWGIGGLCPGPALVALPTGRADVLLFVMAMIGGMLLFSAWDRARALLGSKDIAQPGAQPGAQAVIKNIAPIAVLPKPSAEPTAAEKNFLGGERPT